MPTIKEYYEYAKLSTAAYVQTEKASVINGKTIANQANKQDRLPTALAEQTFISDPQDNPGPVWTINPDGGYYGNDSTGFAATLFERNMGFRGQVLKSNTCIFSSGDSVSNKYIYCPFIPGHDRGPAR